MVRALVIEDAEGEFYALTIVTEMLAEYTGIAISCFYIAFWNDKPIYHPFQYYAKSTLVGTTPNLAPLFYNAAMQLVCEVFVDSFCMYYERRLDHWRSWKMITQNLKIFMSIYNFAVLVGATLATWMVIHSDDLALCKGKDVCFCVNNGLVIGGVIEAYCKRIYPNGTWDAQSEAILGPHISNFTDIGL